MNRDRDPVGRPRNARPRDALGRPLGRARAAEGEAGVPDDLALAGADAAALADQLLRAGRPFHAHEVLEASWKSAPPHERDLWQGLTQVAVGLTHARRGNARGAVALLRRGVQRVRNYQAQAASAPDRDHPYGIEIAAFLAASNELAARIERQGLEGIPAADLQPGLVTAATSGALGKTGSRVQALGPAREIGAGERPATIAGSLPSANFRIKS